MPARNSRLTRLALPAALLLGPGLVLTGFATIAGPPALARADADGAAMSASAQAARGPLTPRSPFLDTDGGAEGQAAGAAPRARWYRGNTHTHTLNSDGDSTPDDVVRWYRENGYQFLVLTDHNFLTAVDTLNALHGADGKFLVIRGEEVSDQYDKKPLHMNGLNLQQLVQPQAGSSVSDVLQRNLDAIRKADGIPHINHPNFQWAITTADLLKLRNNTLFEIYNGHPTVNNVGGGDSPGLEEMWDQILTSGQQLYGIAVDDAHVFKRPWDRNAARPGRGWVVVRTPSLEPRAIVNALDRGEFYASTGVQLERISVTPQGLTIAIAPVPATSKFRTQFVGRGGKVLKEVVTNPAAYTFTGDEGYVRARVIESNGHMAWVQPVFLSAAPSSASR